MEGKINNMKIKYELIYNFHKDYKVCIGEFISNYIPRVGDIVNVNGSPFIVYKIDAAIDAVMGDEQTETYIYISLFKAGTFGLKIRGTKY